MAFSKRTLLIMGLTMLVGIKFLLAAQVGLYADEAFYFQCSLRPALAYADLPPLTALATKVGVTLWGHHPFGVRFVFVLAGLATPVVIFFVARSQVPLMQAWAAAGLALVLPAMGFLSILAIPDVLLGLETALFIFYFERATRKQARSDWICLGMVAGLGILTHYRFATSIFACLAYLFLTSKGRELLRRPGIWLSGLVALPGLLPALIYNVQHDGAPLRYFLLTRHDSQIKPSVWIEHLLEQILVISPLLWVFAIITLIHLIGKARRGDDRACLFSIFAALPLGLFLLASPLQTTGAQSFHWSMPGFLPLLIFMPETLQRFMKPVARWHWRAWVVGMTLASAMLFLLAAWTELGTGALVIRGFREPFSGWREAAQATQHQLQVLRNQNREIRTVVADNYKLGAQLELYLGPDVDVFILDHSKNYEHGRQLQFDRWGMGESSLRNRVGEEVLVAVQWSETAGSREAWQQHLDWFFNPLEVLDHFKHADSAHAKDDKKITFYRAWVTEKK